MDHLDTLFRQRIGMLSHGKINFDNLSAYLERMAQDIPFENLCIIHNRARSITKENLVDKIITRNEGGLCYELNTLLYLFLIENGFDAILVRGRTYDHVQERWSAVGRTHILNVISHGNQQYVVDTGFGANLPLKPVPLNGGVVESHNGEFRVEKNHSVDGEYFLHIKLKHSREDWKLGYVFNATEEIKDFSVLNEVQKIIVEHPESPFNKKPLVTKIDERGVVVLTDTSITVKSNGFVNKKVIDDAAFKDFLVSEFNFKAE